MTLEYPPYRVEVKVMYAVMITAHNALSIGRRGSNNPGKKLPWHSLGITIATSSPVVESALLSSDRCNNSMSHSPHLDCIEPIGFWLTK